MAKPVAPRSTRAPYFRGGVLGFIPFLLPWVWVLDLDSCGHSPAVTTELTGLTLASKLGVDEWVFIGPALALLVLTPFLANALRPPWARTMTHALGLLAAAFGVYASGFVVFFALFSERKPTPAGWLFLSAFWICAADAALRVVWSVLEWRAKAKATS